MSHSIYTICHTSFDNVVSYNMYIVEKGSGNITLFLVFNFTFTNEALYNMITRHFDPPDVSTRFFPDILTYFCRTIQPSLEA